MELNGSTRIRSASWKCISSSRPCILRPGTRSLSACARSSAASRSAADMLNAIVYALPFLTAGLLVTLVVSLLTVSLSLVLGGLLGLVLVYGPAPMRWIVRAFSDVVRGIPILVLIFFVYYAL